MPLFQQSVLKKYLSAQDKAAMAAAYARFSAYFLNKEIQQNIRNSKEEQFQQKFLIELFVNVFGFVMNPDAGFNLTTELKNIKDAKKTDGAILKADGAAIAVIELKGTDTKDLDKVNDQAFNYKNNQPDCVYVITSNFEKLRFYIRNAVEHEEFNLFTLTEERFALLWLFLQKDNLLGGIPAKVKEESLLAEEKITKALYADYSAFKQALWEDMVQRNPQHDQLLLYKKSQKLLDRFLFILFAEDKGLLPPNSISEIVTHWRRLKDMDEYRPMYDIFNKYFGYMNVGRKQPNKAEIHAYNGGLFAEDDVLDVIFISDEVLERHCLKLSTYNFESEVDTNILGHIFEHSLNDIENVRAQLEGTELDKSKTKRKKDGVFYTPKYITKYIVDNTVGKLCEEKKAEIGIDEAEFAKDRKGRKTDTLKKLDGQLKQYRDWLLQLTICDPACGSGAFLNQALEFLMGEHRYVDELEAQLLGYAFEFPGVEAHILEHNIYGVDINEESVEIARLSLWLRTAKKGRKLTSLSSNIKCGNSLIDDPVVAGPLAFNWQQEFAKVFEKGGFDVVIGNPPYGAQISKNEQAYYLSNYTTPAYKLDSYSIFIEKSCKLIGDAGLLSFIVPYTCLTIDQHKRLREYLLTKSITEVINLPQKIFEDADLDTIILGIRIGKSSNQINIGSCDGQQIQITGQLDIANIIEEDGYLINLSRSNEDLVVVNKIRSHKTIIDTFRVSQGYIPYRRSDLIKVYGEDEGNKIVDERLWHSDTKIDYSWKQEIQGRDLSRYGHSESFQYVKYGKHLAGYVAEEFFQKPRLLIMEITRGDRYKISADFVRKELYNTPSIINVISKVNDEDDLFMLLAIINSRLITWYHTKVHPKANAETSIPKILIKDVKSLPIADFKDHKLSILSRDRVELGASLTQSTSGFISLFQSQFDLPKPSTKLQQWPSLDFKGFLAELGKAKVVLSLEKQEEWMAYFTKKKTEANALQNEIDRIDKEIDQLVYQLYGLSPEEIAIVENA